MRFASPAAVAGAPRRAGAGPPSRRAAASSRPTVRAAGKQYLGASCTSWRGGLGPGYCSQLPPREFKWGVQAHSFHLLN